MTDGHVLDGVTVLDLTTFVTGGFCSLMLANQGAEVIKVERPEVGDDNRHSGPPFVDGESPYFWTVNYDKKSVELNLKSDAGREALYDLAAEADVFLQNYRPGTATRLEVDEDSIREHNEGIVYCSISAFGESGPWSQRPGYDLLVQGLGGIMSVTGEEGGQPVKVGLPLTDLVTAMWAAFGVVVALYRRELTGEGESVELGMLDAVLPLLTKQAGKVFAGEQPRRMGTRDPVLAPYQTFETADGHVNVACLNDRLFRRLCEAIDRPDLADDDRYATNADRVEHMDALAAAIEAELREHSTEEWVERLVEDAGIPAAPLHSVDEALYNEQTDARGTVTEIEDPDRGRSIPVVEHPLNFGRATSGFDAPPPKLGEHTREVLLAAGYTPEEVARLEQQGAIGDPETD